MYATPEMVLKEARKLVNRGWSQGAFARDAAGNNVNRDDPSACHYCTLGAILTATDCLPGGGFVYRETVDRLMRAIEGMKETQIPYGIVVWNDDPDVTKDLVLAAFEKAIANE